MAKISDRIGIEHIAALGAGTAALKGLAEDEKCSGMIQDVIEKMAEVHGEACDIIVKLVNAEIDGKEVKWD